MDYREYIEVLKENDLLVEIEDEVSWNLEAAAITAMTTKGTVKTWSTLDAAARWIRSLGIGKAQLDVSGWQPGQRELQI